MLSKLDVSCNKIELQSADAEENPLIDIMNQYVLQLAELHLTGQCIYNDSLLLTLSVVGNQYQRARISDAWQMHHFDSKIDCKESVFILKGIPSSLFNK